jgi:hypothetical protein
MNQSEEMKFQLGCSVMQHLCLWEIPTVEATAIGAALLQRRRIGELQGQVVAMDRCHAAGSEGMR